jgi:hypothetical protein
MVVTLLARAGPAVLREWREPLDVPTRKWSKSSWDIWIAHVVITYKFRGTGGHVLLKLLVECVIVEHGLVVIIKDHVIVG